MSKKTILSFVAFTIVAASVAGISVYASEALGNGRNGDLVQKIAQKLGVDETKVQKAFDEVYQERRQEMESRFEESLTTAISEGKITEEQKSLILKKHEEISLARQSDMESMKDKAPEERRQAMQKEREEMEAWAKENGIDMSLFMPSGPRNGKDFGHGNISNQQSE